MKKKPGGESATAFSARMAKAKANRAVIARVQPAPIRYLAPVAREFYDDKMREVQSLRDLLEKITKENADLRTEIAILKTRATFSKSKGAK